MGNHTFKSRSHGAKFTDPPIRGRRRWYHSTFEVTPVSMVMIGGIVGAVVLHHAVDVVVFYSF